MKKLIISLMIISSVFSFSSESESLFAISEDQVSRNEALLKKYCVKFSERTLKCYNLKVELERNLALKKTLEELSENQKEKLLKKFNFDSEEIFEGATQYLLGEYNNIECSSL